MIFKIILFKIFIYIFVGQLIVGDIRWFIYLFIFLRFSFLFVLVSQVGNWYLEAFQRLEEAFENHRLIAISNTRLQWQRFLTALVGI